MPSPYGHDIDRIHLGVTPLAVSTSTNSRHGIGSGVMGGMVDATMPGILSAEDGSGPTKFRE